MIAMVCWNVWNRRNSVLWKNTRRNDAQVLNSAILYLSDWKLASVVELVCHPGAKRRLKLLEIGSTKKGTPQV